MRTSSAKRWTKKEEKQLAEIYSHRGRALVGNLVKNACDDGLFPGRSPHALVSRITLLKLGRTFTLWSKDEGERFRREVLRHAGLPYRAMGKKLHESGQFPGRTESALANRVLSVLRKSPGNVGTVDQADETEESEPSRQEKEEDDEEPDCFTSYCSEDEECCKCGFAEVCGSETSREYLTPVPGKFDKYTVVKMLKVSGKMTPKTIGDTYTGEPPGKDDIEATLVPQYGGGEYIVINQTMKKVHKRFRFDGPAKDPDAPVAFPGKSLSPIVRMLDDDKRPLMRALLLLPEAKDNQQAWDRIFPRVLKAGEGVYADIDAAKKDIAAARKELEKVAFATRFVQTMQADKLEAVMDECDAALERNKLVDRELKKED